MQLTDRQKRLLDEQNINLVEIYNKLSKNAPNNSLREFYWHYCNGVLGNKDKCLRCGDTQSYEHIFFSCNHISNHVLNQIKTLIFNRCNFTITLWNESIIHKKLQHWKGETSYFIGISLYFIWCNYKKYNITLIQILNKAILGDWYQFREVENPSNHDPKSYKKFLDKWNNSFYYDDFLPTIEPTLIGLN